MTLPHLEAAVKAGATVRQATANMTAPLTPEQIRFSCAEICAHTAHNHPEFSDIRAEGLKRVADAAKQALQGIIQS